MSNVNRYFDTKIAKEFDTDTAIILYNIQFWIDFNSKNKSKEHFYEDKYWTYNSADAFTEVFEWLTEKQIRTRLNKLVSAGYLVEGNFNKKFGDRTKWYALTDRSSQTGTNNLPNGHTEVTKREHRSYQMVTPLPDNKPDKKPNINIEKKSSKQKHNAIALEKEEHVEILNYYNMLFSPNRPSKDKSWYENADYWLETYSLEEIKLAIKNWNAYPHWSKRDGKINGLTFLFRKFNTAREKVNYIDEMLKLDMKPKVEDKLTKQQLIDSKWEELYRNAI